MHPIEMTLVKRKPFTRVVATILAFSLFMTNGVLAYSAETNVWTERREALKLASLVPATPRIVAPLSESLRQALPNPALKFKLSADHAWIAERLDHSVGTIQNVTSPSGRPGSNVVVVIQDVHANEDAQNNIAAAIGSLSREGRLGFVALEGTAAELDLASLRSGDPGDTRSAANYLLQHQQISGAVFSGLTMENNPPRFVGVEDAGLYDQNVSAYRNAVPTMAATAHALKADDDRLRSNRAATFNPALLAFDRAAEDFHCRHGALARYLRSLAVQTAIPADVSTFLEALAMEERLDLDAVNRERLRLLNSLADRLSRADTEILLQRGVLYRSGDLSAAEFYNYLAYLTNTKGLPFQRYAALKSYVAYLNKSGSVDGGSLLSKLDGLETAAYARLTGNDAERRLVRETRALRFKQKLINYELAPDEWAIYKSQKDPSDRSLRRFERFYEVAGQRNDAIASRVQALGQNAKAGVLIIGGFHATAIENQLRRAGLTVVSFTPRIAKISGKDGGAEYLSIFSQEKTPLEKLVMGENIFLARNPGYGLPLVPTLRRLVGSARATEALMLAERIPAEKALGWGMIYKVVPDDGLLAEAMALAARLADGPTISYGQIRQAVRAGWGSDYEAALLVEEEAQRVAGNSMDCGEAVSAFLQKRPPVFRGE